MHVAHLNLLPAPSGWDAAQVFAQWPSLADIAEAVASTGTQVTVVQVSAHTEQLTRQGVAYHFLDPGKRGSAACAAAG